MHSFLDLTYLREVGQKYRNIFIRFLFQMKSSKSHSEINWPLGFNSGRLSMSSTCNQNEMPSLQISSVCFVSLLTQVYSNSLPPRVQIEPGKRIDSEPLGCLFFLSAVLFFYYVVTRWIKTGLIDPKLMNESTPN